MDKPFDCGSLCWHHLHLAGNSLRPWHQNLPQHTFFFHSINVVALHSLIQYDVALFVQANEAADQHSAVCYCHLEHKVTLVDGTRGLGTRVQHCKLQRVLGRHCSHLP